MMEINHLPDEMLLAVHQRLPPFDLKNAVLVCRLWRKVGEDPSLWEWCKVTVYDKEDIPNLAAGRLQRIQEICINPLYWHTEDWEAFFCAVMELSSLKKIDKLSDGRYDPCRRSADPCLFAKALAKLEEAELSFATNAQMQELFAEISWGTQLKKLHLTYNSLDEVNPELFATVLSKMDDVKLGGNHNTSIQMKTLFGQLVNQKCMKKLTLNYENGLSHMDPKLFGRALVKVEVVNLMFCELNNGDQVAALFNEITLSVGSRLKNLDLGNADLSEVQPRQFARSLSGLEEVILDDCCSLTSDQLKNLLTEMLLKPNLKKIHLPKYTNMSGFEPGLVASALARLEDVSFTGRGLPTDQVQEFFSEVSHSSLIKKLDISNINLSSLAPELFAHAVTRVETVSLNINDLSDDQKMSLFTNMSLNMQMKKLYIIGNISSVDPQVLARALNNLDVVGFHCPACVDALYNSSYRHKQSFLCSDANGITHDQVLAFFSEMARNTKLKELYITDDLSSLDSDILGIALAKLKEASLCRSRLNKEQITSIFTRMLEPNNNLKKLDLSLDPIRAGGHVNPDLRNRVKERFKGQVKI